jgi:hypothetical protein
MIFGKLVQNSFINPNCFAKLANYQKELRKKLDG